MPWSRRQSRPRREITIAAEPEPNVRKAQFLTAIHTARSWLNELASGSVASVDAIAERQGRHPRSIRSALAFAFLAPDIVERIIAGDVPGHLTLTDIGRGLSRLWSEQRRMIAG